MSGGEDSRATASAGTGEKATQGDFAFQVLESHDILDERAHVEASDFFFFFLHACVLRSHE